LWQWRNNGLSLDVISINFCFLDVYSHGGMGFLLIASVLCTLLYVLPFAVPYTPLLRRVFLAPERRRFYVYCALLTTVNALQAVGAALVVADVLPGMW
jgi:hypothetical protein